MAMSCINKVRECTGCMWCQDDISEILEPYDEDFEKAEDYEEWLEDLDEVDDERIRMD